jgi:hypothetical protein
MLTVMGLVFGVAMGTARPLRAAKILYPLYTDATNVCQFGGWDSATGVNTQGQSTTGAYEGTQHWALTYTVTAWWQAANIRLTNDVNASAYQYLRMATRGPSVGTAMLQLIDAANNYSAWVSLPVNAGYAVTNIALSAFTGVNLASVRYFRFGMSGVQNDTGVTFSFDNVALVGSDEPATGSARIASVSAADERCLLVHVEEGIVTFDDNASGSTAYGATENDPALNHVVTYGTVALPAAVLTTNWTLHGPGAYSSGLKPTAVYRKTKVNGMAQFGWASSDFNYGYTLEHQFYLMLPQPLTQGGTYTLDVPAAVTTNTATTNVVFDIFQNRSEAIKVNLVGYDTQTTNKSADLYLWMGDGGARDYSSFVGRRIYLYNVATGASNDVGAVSFWMADGADVGGYQMLRSSVWNADINGNVATGVYRLAIQGVGCSQDFVVKSGVYRDPFLVSTLGFYYMRIGQSTNVMVPAPRQPRYIPNQDPAGFRVVKTTMHPYLAAWAGGGDRWDQPGFFANYVQTGSPVNTNAWGGHSDALDWDRHLGHISIIHDLLLPYLLSNGGIPDDDLGIPESGNGIPDVIDEARYEVDFWLRLRDGVGYSHGVCNPSGNTMYQAGATPVAAWAAAANAAMLAEAFRLSGRTNEMLDYLAAATGAYAYADALADPGLASTLEAGFATFRGRDLKMTAAAFLYNLTGSNAWEDVINAESVATSDTSSLATYNSYNQHYASVAYLTTPRTVNYPALRERMRAALVYRGQQEANQRLSRPSRRGTDNTAGYFHTIQNMHNAVIAHAVTTNAAVKEALLIALTLEADYGLGRNPLNMIQMTTATTPLADKRSVRDAYTTGRNAGTPGLHPGHTPYMNMDDWSGGGGMVMARPPALSDRGYPIASQWPRGELCFNTRYVWAHSEFTPQQTMRGKQALYGYLYASGRTLTAYQAWQRLYFTAAQLTNALVSGEAADPDGDHFPNWQEMAAGTDPTNPASFLGITQSTATADQAGAQYVIAWQSATGRVYALEAATNLVAGFSNHVIDIPATPMLNVHTDNMKGAVQRFYRVRLQP